MADGCCKSFAKCILIILNIVFMLLGAIVLGVGIWSAVYLRGLAFLCIIVLICGGVIMALGVIGICGAGYEPGKTFKFLCLHLYFFVMIGIVLILGLTSVLAFLYRGAVIAYINVNKQEWIDTFKDFFNFTSETVQEKVDMIVNYITSSLYIMAGIGIGVAIALLSGVFYAGILLGCQEVLRSTLTFGNIILIAAGGCAIGAGFYVYKMLNVDGYLTPVAIIIGIAGGVVSAIGAFGLLVACCKSKCGLLIYAIVLIILVVACVALGIIAFCLRAKVEAVLTNTLLPNVICKESSPFYDTCTTAYDTLVNDCGIDSTPAYCTYCDGTGDMSTCIVEAYSSLLRDFFVSYMYICAFAAIAVGVFMLYLIIASFLRRSDVGVDTGVKKQEMTATPHY